MPPACLLRLPLRETLSLPRSLALLLLQAPPVACKPTPASVPLLTTVLPAPRTPPTLPPPPHTHAGDFRALIVSDVAARGLDVADCDAVFHLELPTDAAHYAHRAGRTGRCAVAARGWLLCMHACMHAWESVQGGGCWCA